MSFLNDFKVALRSFSRTKGLAITVVLTLALGIGANAAIFTLVRGVLLRPLVNRDENRLIYIRQNALGMGEENAAFSVPELQDLRASVKSIAEFGDFSTMGFTMVGLGEPRVVRGGVVGGNYFEVMGLHPVLGRLLDAHDDGPNAAGAVVLTYRFWNTVLKKDPSVIGKTVRLESMGARMGTIVGVLEPSVPYPGETEIIANVVTSPHHLSATMVTGRVHRMTELFGRLAPGATLEQARAELTAVHSTMVKDHPEAYSPNAKFGIETRLLRDQITSRARTILLVLLAASALVFIIACSNVANLILARSVRREGELAVRSALGASNAALRRTLLAESLAALRSRSVAGCIYRAAHGDGVGELCFAVFRARAGPDCRFHHVVGGRGARADRRGAAGVCAAPAVGRHFKRHRRFEYQGGDEWQHQSPPANIRDHADRRFFSVAGWSQRAGEDADHIATGAERAGHRSRSRYGYAGNVLRKNARADWRVLSRSYPAHIGTAWSGQSGGRHGGAVA